MEKNKSYKPIPNIDVLKYHGTADKPDIKIFVSHRIDLDSETIENPMYIPVRCGAVYDRRDNCNMIGDDTGVNISEKRMSLCELTVQYWAWKNIDADYYGLCHYRRYFSFSNYIKTGNPGWIEFERLDDSTKRKTRSLDFTEQEISEYDITLITPFRLKVTLYEEWRDWPTLHIGDLDCMLNTIKESEPDYYRTAVDYINSKRFYACNMFIMKKGIFHKYCNWLFPLLEKIEGRLDVSHYSIEQARVLAHIAERLLGIFVLYQKQKQDLKIITRQMFYIRDSRTLSPPLILPASESNVVHIVVLCSDYYTPYCATMLTSLAKNSNPDRIYDILIMEERICNINKNLLNQCVKQHKNIKVRYIDIEHYFATLNTDESFSKKIDKAISGTGYNRSLLYRMFCPFILSKFNRFLWLDCDVIVKDDIAKLYDVNLNGHMAGAVHDLILCSYVNGSDEKIRDFYSNKYSMKNIYDYVNAGVVLLDAKKFRLTYTAEYVANLVMNKPFYIVEQDHINLLFENDITFLDPRWNCYALGNPYPAHISFAPAQMYRAYELARKNPGIIHYAGQEKPWNYPWTDFGEEYWAIVRESPVPLYEMTLFRLTGSLVDPLRHYPNARQSIIKRLIKKIVPKESVLWRFLKKINSFLRIK